MNQFSEHLTRLDEAREVGQFIDQVWARDDGPGGTAWRDVHGRGAGNGMDPVDIDIDIYGGAANESAPESTNRFAEGGQAADELSIRLGSGTWVTLTNYLDVGSADDGATGQVWTEGAAQYAALDTDESTSSVIEAESGGQTQAVERADGQAGTAPATPADESTSSPGIAQSKVVLSEGSSTLVFLERENARSAPDEQDDEPGQRPGAIEIGTARKALLDLIDEDRLEEDTADDFLDSPADPEVPIVVDASGAISMLKVQLADIGGPVQRVFGFGKTLDTSDSDKIDLSDVLQSSGYDPEKDDLANYVRIQSDNEGNMVLSVDTSGSGSDFTDVVALHADGPPANYASPVTTGLATAPLDQMLDDSALLI